MRRNIFQKMNDNLKRFPRLHRTILHSHVAQKCYRLTRHYFCDLPQRPCHMHQLFINNAGDVVPCCIVGTQRKMVIGNVRDRDLKIKLKDFSAHCSCERFRLRSAKKGESVKIENINIELDLACQARCVMCCVDAPKLKDKHWTYDLYEMLSRQISDLQPSSLTVQGGEVLAQKKSLEWLKRIKAEHADISIYLVTNGNVTTDLLPTVTTVFAGVTVSFVGFQQHTYRTIMGLELEKTKDFVTGLAAHKNVSLTLKFLVTPVNFHEMSLFLLWALSVKPSHIVFSDASTESYINMKRFDDYWSEIVSRTGKDLVNIVRNYRQSTSGEQSVISFETAIIRLFSQSNAAIATEMEHLITLYLN